MSGLFRPVTDLREVMAIVWQLYVTKDNKVCQYVSTVGNCAAYLTLEFNRAVFTRESKEIRDCFGIALPRRAKWLAYRSPANLSSNQKQNQNQSCLARTLFPALCIGYMLLFWILIVSLDCLWNLWNLRFWIYDTQLKIALTPTNNNSISGLCLPATTKHVHRAGQQNNLEFNFLR